MIPHTVGVQPSCSPDQQGISWRESKSSGETLCNELVEKQFAQDNNGILTGADAALDNTNTENNSEMKTEAEEMTLQRLAKVHDLLEMWQCSQNPLPPQMESRTQNKQMTAVGDNSDMEEIVKEFWSLFQHDGAAAFTLSERSVLPPGVSVKDLPGGRTQILNIRRII
jgi:hypothetical protein